MDRFSAIENKIMKRRITILFTALLVIGCSRKEVTDKAESRSTWSKTKRIDHLKNQEDSTTWDKELLETDKQLIGIGDFGPFELGAFPVPRYDLIGKESFNGLGNKTGEFQMKNKNLLMNSFFISNNTLNEKRLNSRKDEIFFQIIVLTDTISNENQSVVLSRNHPDYFGQGFVRTINNRIDYLAFQTAENNSYAIVNTKIFDLNYGKTVLVAQKKDKTLRFLQIDQKRIITSDSIVNYTEKLLLDKKVVDFFEQKGSI